MGLILLLQVPEKVLEGQIIKLVGEILISDKVMSKYKLLIHIQDWLFFGSEFTLSKLF
ncbi:MAG: hypothetical protein ABJR05_14935 [Balneola sp.]